MISLAMDDEVTIAIVWGSTDGGCGVGVSLEPPSVEVAAKVGIDLGGKSCVPVYNVAGKVVIPSARVKEAVPRTQQLP